MSGHYFAGIRAVVHNDRPAVVAVCACGDLGDWSFNGYSLDVRDETLRESLYPHLKESALQALEDSE